MAMPIRSWDDVRAQQDALRRLYCEQSLAWPEAVRVECEAMLEEFNYQLVCTEWEGKPRNPMLQARREGARHQVVDWLFKPGIMSPIRYIGEPVSRSTTTATGGLSCADCKLPYSDAGFCDFVVPDEVWARIKPDSASGAGSGLLCAVCMCRRMVNAGLTDIDAAFTSGPCAVKGWTKRSLPDQTLAAEIAYFDRTEEIWQACGHGGRFVVLKTRPVVDGVQGTDWELADSAEQAYERGLKAFGNVPMLIRQIGTPEKLAVVPSVWFSVPPEPIVFNDPASARSSTATPRQPDLCSDCSGFGYRGDTPCGRCKQTGWIR